MSSVATEPHVQTTASAPPVAGPQLAGELALLHRSLAEYCRAGVPLPRALRTLGADLRSGKLRAACAEIAADVEVGTPFAEAYARHAVYFPDVYVALVDAGTRGSSLPATLDEIARHASLATRARDTLRRRLEAPLWAAGLIVVLALVVLIGVGPFRVQAVFEGSDFGATGLSATTLWWLVAGGALVLGGLVVCAFAWLRRPLERRGPRRLAYRWPLLGPLRADLELASFCATLALLLRRQQPLDRALRLVAATVAEGVRPQVERMAVHAEQGAGLGDALRAGELVPESLLWFVEAAATAGPDGVARALDDLAAMFRDRVERGVERTATFAVPVVQLASGLVVLLFALGYAFPALVFFRSVFGLGG